MADEQWPIELHLRVRVLPEKLAEFRAFLVEAIPFYEKPGGIRVTLWQDASDPTRFIEKVQYASQFAYCEDDRRVHEDPATKSYLARWRVLLAEPPRVEQFRFTPVVEARGEAIPTLTTPRLVLRPFTMLDAPRVAELAGERRVAEWTLTVPHPYSEADGRTWIATHTAGHTEGKHTNWAITIHDTGELIGAIGVVYSPAHEKAEIGYWLGLPYWSRGYTTEAALAVRDYCFGVRRLNRIDSHHMRGNDASGKVMQRMGMAYEGTLLQAVKKWGAFKDIVCYAMTRAQWLEFTTHAPPTAPASPAPPAT